MAADGTTIATGNDLLQVSSRKGALQTGDFGNVGAYAFTSGGSPMIGLVTQLSWVASEDVLPASETTEMMNQIDKGTSKTAVSR